MMRIGRAKQPRTMHKSRSFIWLLIVALIGSIGYLQFYMRRASAPQLLGRAIRFVSTQAKVVSITFDDGPNPESTKQILDLLKKYDARATFFVIGRNAEKYPELVKATIASGNELGNHSWDHQRLTYKNPAFVRRQIESTDRLLRELGYEREIPFRAPYGHKLLILPLILVQSDRIHYLWNIELDDWDSPSPQDMLQRCKGQIKPGSIVLLHDGYTGEYQPRSATVELVEMLLDYCKEESYKVVPVSELRRYHGRPARSDKVSPSSLPANVVAALTVVCCPNTVRMLNS